MVNALKFLIKRLIRIPSNRLASLYFMYEAIIHKLLPQMAGTLRQNLYDKLDGETKTASHGSGQAKVELNIHTPNYICAYRHRTFASKEPEMFEWIHRYGGDGAFFDIGANIGLYSMYYAQTQPGAVYSFEPSVFNLRQLVKNVNANSLNERITIVTSPLSDKSGISTFINGSQDEGGALSAFGVDHGQDGQPLNSDMKYKLVGFSIDALISMGVIPEPPRLIKIDVDGNEHIILRGAVETLKSKELRSLYIEVNDGFQEQAEGVSNILQASGFTLSEKSPAVSGATTDDANQYFNQIWTR